MQHVLELTWTNTATYDWKVYDHAFNALIGMESYQMCIRDRPDTDQPV